MEDAERMVQSGVISILEVIYATKLCVTRQDLTREMERLGEVIPKEITPTIDIGMSSISHSDTYGSPNPKKSRASSGSNQSSRNRYRKRYSIPMRNNQSKKNKDRAGQGTIITQTDKDYLPSSDSEVTLVKTVQSVKINSTQRQK